jgi:hypothetical protein
MGMPHPAVALARNEHDPEGNRAHYEQSQYGAAKRNFYFPVLEMHDLQSHLFLLRIMKALALGSEATVALLG